MRSNFTHATILLAGLAALPLQAEVPDYENPVLVARLNNNGLVAFRAFDDGGDRAIWVGDGDTLRPIVQAGDLVDTDIGPLRIRSAIGGPEFSGGIEINENGDLAFVASLTDPDNPNTERGRGIFVVPARGEVILADGFES